MCNELTLVASRSAQCGSLGQVLFTDIACCDIATVCRELQHHFSAHSRAATSDYSNSSIKTIFKSCAHRIPLFN
jgi:hypothetical protein